MIGLTHVKPNLANTIIIYQYNSNKVRPCVNDILLLIV
jgi:hypothetical protein